MAEQRNIAIVGAGIGGMTLAAILSRFPNPPSIHVFERDKRDRDQGTGFDIRKEGQEVLKRAGVFDKYYEYSRVGSDIMKFYAMDKPDPFVIFSPPVLLRRWIPPSPESNRQLLREALIEVLERSEGNSIQFECKVLDIQQKGNQAELIGVNSTVLGCFDLVIDASGFSSPLRKYRILDEDENNRFEQYYTGITMLHGLIRDPEQSCPPELVQKFGQGTMMVFGAGKGFGMQRYGAAQDDRRTSFYYSAVRPRLADLCTQLDLPQSTRFITDPDQLNRVKAWIHEDMGNQWEPVYHAAVDCVESIAIRPLLQHPQNPRFDDQSTLPLILIGDALHVVPPYTGSGGNLALDDANDLADFLLKNSTGPIDIEQLRALEKKLMARAVSVMKFGDDRKKQMLLMDSNFKAGKKMTSYDIFGSYFIAIIATLVTWLFYFECFIGLRKNK